MSAGTVTITVAVDYERTCARCGTSVHGEPLVMRKSDVEGSDPSPTGEWRCVEARMPPGWGRLYFMKENEDPLFGDWLMEPTLYVCPACTKAVRAYVNARPTDASIPELRTMLGRLFEELVASGGHNEELLKEARALIRDGSRTCACGGALTIKGQTQCAACLDRVYHLDQLLELLSRCPLGWHEGKTLMLRSTTDAKVVEWLQAVDALRERLAKVVP